MGFPEKVLNLKALIVEDNAFFREMLKEKLQTVSSSMVIDEAAEGKEALEKVEALKPELVLWTFACLERIAFSLPKR